VITGYSANFNSMKNEVADKLVPEATAIEVDRTKQIQSYLPKLKKVLSAKKVARSYQLENNIRAAVNFQLAVNIRLVRQLE
jgi:hypothetical protein